jgi:MFS family permease
MSLLGLAIGDYRSIPKEAVYLIYASFLPSLATGMFFIDISYFLTTVQGLSDVFMGTLIMIIGVTAVVTGIPLGVAADRYGRKRSLVIGNILASCSIAMFGLTTNHLILMISAAVAGVSQAAFSAAGGALLAEKAGDESRTSAFSLYSFANSSASGLGSFMIPVVLSLERLGLGIKNAHVMLYVSLGLLSLASTFLMLKVSESKRPPGMVKKGVLSRKSMKILARYVLPSAIIAFGAGMVVPLMTRWLYLKYGASDAVSGPILGTSSFLIGFASLTVPALARRLGVVKAIVLTQGLSTLFMFATPLCPNYLVASASYIVRAFLMNMSSPLQQSLIMGLVAQNERGAASGISAALWRLPNSLSTGIGASLMGGGMLAAPFYLATLLYVVAIVIFWLSFRKMKLKN